MKREQMESYEWAKVIIDTRDGRKDKLIPRREAEKLYDAGKLCIDLTNSQGAGYVRYCPIKEEK